MMTENEERKLQDALTTHLFFLTGVQQALWHVRQDSNEYPMFPVLAESMSNSIESIMEKMPEDWRNDLLEQLGRAR